MVINTIVFNDWHESFQFTNSSKLFFEKGHNYDMEDERLECVISGDHKKKSKNWWHDWKNYLYKYTNKIKCLPTMNKSEIE